jgi:hypothetical protein
VVHRKGQAYLRREGDSNPRALWAKAFQVREPISVTCGAVRLSWPFSRGSSTASVLFGPVWPEIMDRIMDWNRAASDPCSCWYLPDVASEDRIGQTPLLDEWLAEVGEDGVIEAVVEARRRIAEGETSGFSDEGEFFKHLYDRHRMSP